MKSEIKVKIYAKKTKIQLLKQSLGNSRFIWNKLLEKEKEKYKKEKRFIFYAEMCREITKMRKKYTFLKNTSIWGLQQIARKLDSSLKNFFKHKGNRIGFPKYKSKKKYEGILIYPRDFRFKDKKLYLPKIGWVSIKDKITKKRAWQRIEETAKQVWIKEDPDGFFAYIVYEREKKEKEKNGEIVGVDIGIKNTITMSNGEILSLNKDKIMALVQKVEHLQSIIDTKRNINKKRKFSAPFLKRRIDELERRRDKILKKIKNIKVDFYYKAINHILNSHEYVAVEDLNLKELKELWEENKKMNKNVHKYLQYISLSKFFRILDWKAELYDRKVIKVDPKDTSKQCSNCGYINHDLKLSDRIFRCPACGLKIDRDLNASINILKRGLERIASSSGHGEYMREMPSMRAIRRTLTF